MAKDLGSIRLVGTAQANAAAWDRIVKSFGLGGGGIVTVGNIEIVTLTPKLMDQIAATTGRELAKVLSRRTKR